MTNHHANPETVADVLSSIRAIIENEGVSQDLIPHDLAALESHATGRAADRLLKGSTPTPDKLRGEDMFDLTEAMMRAGQKPAAASPVHAQAPRVSEATAVSDASPLISAQAAASTTAAFDQFKQASAHHSAPSGAVSMEDLVQGMLRPLLREWIDAHLPALVHKIVSEEIEKMRLGR